MKNNNPFHKIAEKWKYLCSCLLCCKMAGRCNQETYQRQWIICNLEIIVFILFAPGPCPKLLAKKRSIQDLKFFCSQPIIYNVLVNCLLLFKFTPKLSLETEFILTSQIHTFISVSSNTPCAGLNSLIMSQGGKRTGKTVQYGKQCALENSWKVTHF